MLNLYRTYFKDRTEGRLPLPDGKQLYTLERPDLNNKPFVSCIPEGTYIIVPDSTGRWQYFKVLDVPKRSFIEIHPATIVDHLEGCIAPGYDLKNGRLYDSPKACKTLQKWFSTTGWVLRIRTELETEK